LIEKAGPTWSALNRSSIHDIRMKLVNQVREADFEGRTRKYGSGRGIVFTAGNAVRASFFSSSDDLILINIIAWYLRTRFSVASTLSESFDMVRLRFSSTERVASLIMRFFLFLQSTELPFQLRSITSLQVIPRRISPGSEVLEN